MCNDLFANIIVDITTDALNKSFVFKIPDELKDRVIPGIKVSFPFGKGNKLNEGFVIEVLNQEQLKGKKFYKNDAYFKKEGAIDNLKEIADVLDTKIGINELMLKLAIYMCKEYYCPLVNCLNTVIPVKKIIRKNKRQNDAITKYEVNIEEQTEKNEIVLNEEQKKVVKEILEEHKKETFDEHLIFGVTGSGKTEVYLEIIEKVLSENKKVIVLIPEIALTHQTVLRLKYRFGDKVAIIHSKMSQGDRYIQYNKCEKGEAQILVGPRSAIFAPFVDLGLVVIDEVNDSSYKSETAPRYGTIDVARFRCKEQNATLITLSATPNITLYHEAINGDRIHFHKLENRAKSTMPNVTIVDMKEEIRSGNKNIFSKLLIEKIHKRLEKKEQVMLYMNRRGFDTIFTCKECGETYKCPHCDVSLVAHNDGKMKCHYCGYEVNEPLVCPYCKSKDIERYGMGTEKVEDLCIELFPSAKILRMDRDTTTEKDAHDKIIEKFRKHEADILIGTQMIVKGHDFKDVTLVAVLRADLTLYQDGYNASENAFSMLTQCVGRSGRAGVGESIIQAYDVESDVLEKVSSQDFVSFYNQEIKIREKLNYPPFCKLLIVTISSVDKYILSDFALNLKALFDYKNEEDSIILGPAVANPEKVKDIYSKLITIKCANIEIAKKFRRISNQYYKNTKNNNLIKIIYDIE